MSPPLRVGIEAQLVPGVSGGVQQTIIGLGSALSSLDDGDEEYVFLTQAGGSAWLRPYLGGPCSVLEHPMAPPRPGWRRAVTALVPQGALSRLDRLRAGRVGAMLPMTVPWSDGTAERAGVHLMHFALQNGYRTRLPSIYVPHDLQHVHFPEHFGPADWRYRDLSYRQLCQEARAVVALTRWGKRDLVSSFALPDEKIFVIGWPPVLEHYPAPSLADLAATRARLALPATFALYPAQTFVHKNHRKLIEALAILRDHHGLRVDLVCTGHQNDLCRELAAYAQTLGLASQVRFLGFVSTHDLRCLYGLARLLVFPSLFEGFGMPVHEAFLAGVPVACSETSSLEEVAGGAARLFRPERPDEMAEAVRRLWSDEGLRAELVARGQAQVRGFSWKQTAKTYRAVFRRASGRPPTAEDRALLEAAR